VVVRTAASNVNVDVAGIRLGMSVEAVRSVLRSKQPAEYVEYTAALGPESYRRRFVNVVAARSPFVSASVSPRGGAAGEYYEVMFTPVPGGEVAMAVVHSVTYASDEAVSETVLDAALQKKYGGGAQPEERRSAATWRVQRDGSVQAGDACERRGVIASQEELKFGITERSNLALKTTLDEFQHQIDHCGIAIVTADRTGGGAPGVGAPGVGAPAAGAPVAHLRVTAYSPLIGFEGVSAAAQVLGSLSSDASASEPRGTRTPPDL